MHIFDPISTNRDMSDFTNFENFEHVADSYKIYRLKSPLIWDIGAEGSNWRLEIAKGSTFDISVPRLLEWVLSPHDRRVLPAAAVHDELLRRGFDIVFASAEFRRAIIARGLNRLWAWLLFFATLIWTALRS